MPPLVYLDNHFVSLENAKVSVFDLAISRGYGVTDYLRTYNRIPFRLDDHLLRFQSSSLKVGIELSSSFKELKKIVLNAIDRAPFEEVSIKMIATGGHSFDGYLPDGKPRFILIASPFTPYKAIYYEKGATLSILRSERHFPLAKTTEYLPAIVALKKAQEKGAIDLLQINSKNELLETGFANFFAFKKGSLITPNENILFGVTRSVVLDSVQNHFPLELRALREEEIPLFEGAFITSSNKEVMPIVQIGPYPIGDKKVSEPTKEVMRAFKKRVEEECSKEGLLKSAT